jgi:ribosomal protein S19
MQKPVTIGRDQSILKEHVGQVYYVHNGQARIKVRPVRGMVGLKYGEFSKTRTPRAMGKKKGAKKRS